MPGSVSSSTSAAPLVGEPLPVSTEWVRLRERNTGKTYYWNRRTNSTVWQAPSGVEVVWYSERDEEGGIWYWHRDTRVSFGGDGFSDVLTAYGPLVSAFTFPVSSPEECSYAEFSGRSLPETFPCSALFGSTVDTCLRQLTRCVVRWCRKL